MEINYKKKFGQNFLTDSNLLAAIVADSKIDGSSTAVEIGVGAAALTKQLAKVAKKVVCWEVDGDLKPVIDQNLQGIENTRVIYQDFLKATNEQIKEAAGTNFSVVANLPYYITSPIITKLLDSSLQVSSITIMVQQEVGERIIALPNTSEYGVLSVMVQLCGQAKITRRVSRQMFTPVPNVDSCMVQISNIKRPNNYTQIVEFVKKCFFARRKTLVNNLGRVYAKQDILQALQALGLPQSVRAEALSAGQFELLFKELSK